MKLKGLRQCFRRDGPNWVPKKKFTSITDAREQGFHSEEWHIYKCSECNSYHAADLKKKVQPDVNI